MSRITKPYTAKSRPILFNAEMVKAILDGHKTQTRRVIKNDFMIKQEENYPYNIRGKHALWNSFKTLDELVAKFCPHGKPGDFLWVKEGFETFSHRHVENHDRKYPIHRHLPHYPDSITLFRVDDYDLPYGIKWSSPIFMHKYESRITLEITEVRVERVQQITPLDATKESCFAFSRYEGPVIGGIPTLVETRTPIEQFIRLWDSINKKRGYSWESNPWVFIIEFERSEKAKE